MSKEKSILKILQPQIFPIKNCVGIVIYPLAKIDVAGCVGRGDIDGGGMREDEDRRGFGGFVPVEH